MPNVATLQQITETCPVDDAAHNFMPVPNQPPWVYCTKCLLTMEVTFGEPPTEPPTEPPETPDGKIIHPTGGDDTGYLQDEFEMLPNNQALILSGMFNVSDTVWLTGSNRTIAADPAKRSGIRVTADGVMVGPYGCLLAVEGAGIEIIGLEFDGNNKPALLIEFLPSAGCAVARCYFHDLGDEPQGGGCFAAIHSQAATDLTVTANRIERTGNNVRGIWIPTRKGALIESNHVTDTRHTGIAFEGDGGVVRNNIVDGVHANGTGYKCHYRVLRKSRRASPKTQEFHFTGNTAMNTVNAGLMLEQCALPLVNIENNVFQNCGAAGTSFGALYTSSPATNVRFRNNRVENCRSIAGCLNLNGAQFTDNQIVGGPATVNLEQNCQNITLDNSGAANVGPNCSNVYVDGVKVA